MNKPKLNYGIQAFWAGFGQIIQAIIALIGLTILVSSLGAESYGLYAVAILCVSLCDILVGGHAGDGIVSIEDLRPTHTSSLFWILVALAFVSGGCLWFAQGLIADMLEMAEAASLIGFACGLPLLTALTTVPNQILVRRVAFSALARGSAAGALVGTAAGITSALAQAGPFSLIIMEYVRRITILAFNLNASGWRPAVSMHPVDAMVIGRIGLGRIENQAVQFFSTQALPRVLIGAALGPASLGIYVIAKRLLDQLNGILSGPISAVLLPAFARARHDPIELRRIMEKAIRASTMMFWPALLGLAVVAPVAVPVLFGSNLAEVTPIIQILIIASLRTPLSGFTNALFAGLGHQRTISRLQWVSFAMGALLLAVAIPGGLVWMASAIALKQWLVWPLSAVAISRTIGLSPKSQLTILARSALAPCLMAIGVAALSEAIDARIAPIVELMVLVLAGLLLYPLALISTSSTARRIIPQAFRMVVMGQIRQGVSRARELLH